MLLINTFLTVSHIAHYCAADRQISFLLSSDVPSVAEPEINSNAKLKTSCDSFSLYLQLFDSQMSEASTDLNLGNWKYETNITPETERLSVEANNRFNERLGAFLEISKAYVQCEPHFTKAEKRQWNLIKLLTTPKNPNLSESIAAMSRMYSVATYKGMKLDPDLENVMSNERDYDVLEDVYMGWREVTADVKPIFSDYVNYANEVLDFYL